MKKYNIKLNNKVYEVEIEEMTGEAREAAATRTQSSTPAPASTKAQPVAQSTGGTAVDAPMGGSILSIDVKVGDQVKTDQVLMILEAMKMENEICSPINGSVLSIAVSKGDTVNAGVLLVKIG